MPFESSAKVPLEQEVDRYKYCIIIDGHVSSWGLPAFVLLSDCVPFVVQSEF